MKLESFRRALGVRHREAVACALARLQGEIRDEARLDELDADLFSREATAASVAAWIAPPEGEAPTGAAIASVRSRAAIVLEEGLLARMRPLDRTIEEALGRGRFGEAEELAHERRRLLSAEGKRVLVPSADGAPAVDARTVAAVTRGESAEALEASARKLLDESAAIAEQAVALAGRMVSARASAEVRGKAPAPEHAGLGHAQLLGRILEFWCGAAPEMPSALVAPALRELGMDLGIDAREALTIAVTRSASAPVVLEIDPPDEVLLALAPEAGFDAFGAALDAWGTSLAPLVRGPALPDEHRLHADAALGRGVGALGASLAPEHARLRREPLPAGRRALAGEIASARLAAALFLDRDRVLAGSDGGADGFRDAVEEASLGRARPASVDRPREPIFASMDRFRGHLLAPHLRERLRTRFGNLWYRERGAGRLLREACEPGGSLLTTEILAGLSIPRPGAEGLLDSWREEIKRLR